MASQTPETTATTAPPVVNAADTMVISRDDLAKMLSAAADQALAKAKLDFLGAGGPPKILQAHVSDGFIKGDQQAEGGVLRTYRVDGVAAMKILEMDMNRLRYYEELKENTPDEMPLDREGFPYTPRAMSLRRNKFINVMNGRVAARSENQVAQLEWMKTLSSDEGGLPGLYEVTEETQLWQCNTCQPPKPFQNKVDWAAHRAATHGIPLEDAA